MLQEGIFGMESTKEVPLEIHIFNGFGDAAIDKMLAACATEPGGNDRSRQGGAGQVVHCVTPVTDNGGSFRASRDWVAAGPTGSGFQQSLTGAHVSEGRSGPGDV